MRSNCLIFALALYFRRRRSGREGYIVIRRSRLVPFVHALYAERRNNGLLRVVSFVPKNPKHKAIPPPYFTGSSKWGDLP